MGLFLGLRTWAGHVSMLVSFAIRDIAKSKTILVLVIVSLSVAFSAIFLSTSILKGFQSMLADGATGYLGHIVIKPAGERDSIPRLEAIAQNLAQHPNIAGFSTHSEAFFQIQYDETSALPYRTVGLDPRQEETASVLTQSIISGRFFPPSATSEVVLGKELADALVGQAFDGDLIPAGATVEIKTIKGTVHEYRVAGIIDAKTFFPNWYLILPKQELEDLPGSTADTELIVLLKDKRKLTASLHDLQDSTAGVDIVTWEQESGYVNDIIKTVNFIMGMINILLTASTFVVMSIIIFINVFQKKRQIGIIKSMGTSNFFIVTVYVLEAIVYAVLSYGLGFGIFWAIHHYSVNHPIPMLIGDFTTTFSPEDLRLSLLTLAFAALGGSMVPAYVAARTKIVDVIRSSV